jgi:hypothetical protein
VNEGGDLVQEGQGAAQHWDVLRERRSIEELEELLNERLEILKSRRRAS